MMVEISGKIFLGIISLLVGLLDVLIIFLISDRKISESAVVLGKRTCQREVVLDILDTLFGCLEASETSRIKTYCLQNRKVQVGGKGLKKLKKHEFDFL